jgi:DNA-directed RNA polymerase specialized sigma24 family protein
MNPDPIQPAAASPKDRARQPAVRALTSTPKARHTKCDGGSPMTDEDRRRRELLSDPEILESVRTVLRLRGVPLQDIEDVLNTVLIEAQNSPGLPLDDREQARLFLGGIARHKAVDHARARKRAQKRHAPGEPEEHLARVASKALPPDEQVFARRLLELGRKLFPRTHGWFERSIQGETHVAIAADAHVAEGTVSHEISNIRRTLRNAATAVLVVFILFVGIRTLTRESGNVAKSPQQWAHELRDQAQRECAAKHWKVCRDELKAAADIDSDGDTQELKDLRTKAQSELDKLPDNAPPR